MTVPETRIALEASAARAFARLQDALDALPDSERSQPFADDGQRDRDVEDILNHLHAWHVLLVGWIDEDAAGGSPAYPAEGYTWRELDALNHKLRDDYRLGDPNAARERLHGSHLAVLARIKTVSDEELFEDDLHPWMRGQLAEPVHECLGGHYAWAIGALEAGRTRVGAPS